MAKRTNGKKKNKDRQNAVPVIPINSTNMDEVIEEKAGIIFEQVVSRGCGIDVHKKIIVVSIAGEEIESTTKTFNTFTGDLENLRDWLKKNSITHIAMESTGVYWKPIYNILESDFEIILVNARHIKNVPGKKTDKKDSEWICKLLLSGLLSGSFIPQQPIRELRDLTRYRCKITQQIAAEKNRLQKILEDGNIKLSSVVSNMSGASATKIVDAIIEGENDPETLFSLCHGKLKAKEQDIVAAVKGQLTEHHKFMLKTIKKSIKEKEDIIKELNTEIDNRLDQHQLTLDAELLQSIPGVGKEAAESIIAEIGNDMDQFPSEKHLASWSGLSPGNNESAGKKKSSRITHGDIYLKALIVQCAWAATRTKNTYLRSKYDSLVPRRGKKRALIAVGHKILIAAYHILKDKVEYKELGADYLESRRKHKAADRYVKKLKEMGYDIEIKVAA
jgi:transposase